MYKLLRNGPLAHGIFQSFGRQQLSLDIVLLVVTCYYIIVSTLETSCTRNPSFFETTIVLFVTAILKKKITPFLGRLPLLFGLLGLPVKKKGTSMFDECCLAMDN